LRELSYVPILDFVWVLIGEKKRDL